MRRHHGIYLVCWGMTYLLFHYPLANNWSMLADIAGSFLSASIPYQLIKLLKL